MKSGFYSWSFVLMFMAFSIFLSYISGSFIFLMIGVFPFAGKMMFGPRNEKSTEAVRRGMKKKWTWFLLALAGVIGYISYVLVTQEAARATFTTAAVLGVLALIYTLAVVSAGKNLDESDDHDNYG